MILRLLLNAQNLNDETLIFPKTLLAILYKTVPTPKIKMFNVVVYIYTSRDMRFLTMWYVRPAKAQTSQNICALHVI